MENASKALIIAGAILISILLISVAVLIVNSSRNLTDQQQKTVTAMGVDTFNNQFNIFVNPRLSAAQTKELISKVRTNNRTNGSTAALNNVPVATNNTNYLIKLTGVYDEANVVSSRTYKVEISNYDDAGYITTISITQNT